MPGTLPGTHPAHTVHRAPVPAAEHTRRTVPRRGPSRHGRALFLVYDSDSDQ